MLARTHALRLLLLLGAAFSVPAQADLWKWTDGNGVVNYGNEPPPGVRAQRLEPGERVTVVPALPTPAEAAAPVPSAPAAAPDPATDARIERLEQQLESERRAREQLEADADARRRAAIAACQADNRSDCEATGGVIIEPGPGWTTLYPRPYPPHLPPPLNERPDDKPPAKAHKVRPFPVQPKEDPGGGSR